MNNSEFAIYRLCWNQKKVDLLKKQSKKYGFSNTRLVTGPDYFQFLDEIIKNCEFDYALVVHDDVYLPLNIKSRVSRCIKGIDEKYGKDNWGVAGNAGIEYMNNEAIRFISDPHSSAISPSSIPVPLIAIDGNTMLLNIKNLKKKKVTMPSVLSGFHFYDTSLLIECYKHDLVCVADPNLFVIHKSGGDQDAFDVEAKDGEFKNYFKKDFINKTILVINGLVEIENSYDYLKRGSSDKRKDFYSVIDKVIKKHSKKEVKKVFIIVKTQLSRINYLERFLDSCVVANSAGEGLIDLEIILSINNSPLSREENEKILKKIRDDYKELSIKSVFVELDNDQFPRVKAIKDAVNSISDENSYVWMVDDDDFIFPQSISIFASLLDQSFIFVGDIARFNEKWDDKQSFPLESDVVPGYYITKNYFRGFQGDNHAPINAFVFPFYAIKKVFDEYELLGDYYEDYAYIMFAQNYANVKYYPAAIAGVSFHGDNTVVEKDRGHWDVSLATFMSEFVNRGIARSWSFEMLKEYEFQGAQLNRWRRVFRLAKPVIRITRRLGIIK